MVKAKSKPAHQLNFDFHFDSVISKGLIAMLLFFAAYWMMLPVMDLFPQRDSGCFLYIGQNWLKGMIPYRDMWDHKGPLLYLLNATGIFFNGLKGVMFMQVLLTSLGFYFLYITLSKTISHTASLMVALSGIFILFFLHQSGNQTEQWALFFEGLTLSLYFKVRESKSFRQYAWLSIGFLLACSFLLRPNQIALWLIIVLCELVFLVQKRQSVKTLLMKAMYGLSGFAIPVALFSAYFLYHHAFDEMMDCLFTYNFIYTGQSNSSLINNIIDGIRSVPGIWVFFAGVAFNLAVFIVKKADGQQWFVLLFGAAWLTLEMILSGIGSAGHTHYYVQWILPLLILAGSFISSLKLVTGSKQKTIYLQAVTGFMMVGLFFFSCNDSRSDQMAQSYQYKRNSLYREQIVDIVTSKTDDSDYVLVWGMVDGINFMAERRSPTRYFYPYALDTKGYTNEARVKEYVDEIKARKPKYIIDFSRMERFPSVFPAYRNAFYAKKPGMKGMLPSNIDSFYNYVRDHYETDDGKGDITGSALILMRLD